MSTTGALSGLLDRLTGRLRSRQRQHAEGFEQLVARVADNKAPADEDVERALAAAGKSPEDLLRAVQNVLRRRQLRQHIADAQRALADRPKVEASVKAADAARERALAAAEEKHDAAVGPLGERLRQIDAAEQAGIAARDELAGTAPDGLKARAAALREKLAAARAGAARVEEQLADADARLRHLESEVEHTTANGVQVRLDPQNVERNREQLPAARRRAEELRAALANGTHAELERQIADVEQQMLAA